MKKWEIAVSSAFWGSPTEENVKKMFEDCRRSGIHLIELAIGDLKEEKLFDWEKLAEMAKEYGVKIRSFHIPFCPFDIPSLETQVAEQTAVLHRAAVLQKVKSTLKSRRNWRLFYCFPVIRCR